MPRTRTTPTPIKTAHYDTIDIMVLQIAYDSNLQVSLPNTKFSYGITNRDAAGWPVNEVSVEIPWGELPPSVKTDLRSIFDKALLDAENKGHMGEGTDGNDIP